MATEYPEYNLDDDDVMVHGDPNMTFPSFPSGNTPDLDSLSTSTNDIGDDDLIVSKEDGGSAWVKKTAAKLWNYIKTKLGISAQGSTGKYLDEQGNFTTPPNTTYNAMTSSELSTGTATTLRTMRADYAKDGIKQLMLDMCYPVGSIYTSTKNVSPATFLGGTWKSHSGYILRGATSNVSFDDNSNTGNGFGGSDSVTLTGAQSGLKGHGHGFTQPTVNNGSCSITSSGTHQHKPYYTSTPKSGGSGTEYPSCTSDRSSSTSSYYINKTDGGHTHTVPNHTHSVSGGAVSDASASTATSSHSVVQRYKNVYIWERTA